MRSLVQCREHALVVDGRFQETALRRDARQTVAQFLGRQVEGHETALILAQFAQPLPITHVEIGGQRVVERGREESVRDFGLVLRVAASDVLFQLMRDVHIGQMELRQLPIDQCSRLHAEILQRERLLVVGEAKFLVNRVLRVAIDGLQLVVGNRQEVENRQGSDILHEMGVVALSVAARIVEIRVRRHLVAEVIASVDFRQRQIDSVLAQTRQIVVVIEQGRLRFRDEIATRNRAVVVLLHVEIRQNGQRTDSCVAQVASVVDLGVVGCVANVFHDNRIARSTRSAEDARHDKNAVGLLEHIRELAELLRVLELVERDAADVGRADETDVHLRLQLIVAEHHRTECLIARVERRIVDEILEFLRLDGTHIEQKRVAQLRAIRQDVGQTRNLHREEAFFHIDLLAVERAPNLFIPAHQVVGALQIFVGLVRINDDGNNLKRHRLALLIDGMNACGQLHHQRSHHARPCAAYKEKE